MSTIKKGFVEVYNVLVANKESKVEDIMDQLIGLMESQQRDKNHYIDENGELFIFCYYHKEWEHVGQVEFGFKKSTATGYNSMCRIGTNQWTKQQRDFKQSRGELLDKVASGDLEMEDLKDAMSQLDEAKDQIVSLADHFHEEGLEMEAELQLERDHQEALEIEAEK